MIRIIILSIFALLENPILMRNEIFDIYSKSWLLRFFLTASVFGLMGVLDQLMSLSGSMLSNQIYRNILTILHGSIVFLAAAGCGLISLTIMM